MFIIKLRELKSKLKDIFRCFPCLFCDIKNIMFLGEAAYFLLSDTE